jgi:predicted RNase H-like HicB family nuclease
MKSIKYVIYKEDKYFVVQCLNIELSTFGESIDEALSNLEEALSLYFEDEERRF